MLKIGIIGAGNIAKRFASSAAKHPKAEVVAVSARRLEQAEAFAHEFGIANFFDSYDALMRSGVDVVYLAVPHGLHAELAIKAMGLGVGVLTEKPAVVRPHELEEIAAAKEAHQVFFAEGMKTRFIPAYKALKQTILEGEIGELTRISASWEAEMPKERIEQSYLSDPIQGGSLLDCGCYLLSYITDFFNIVPTVTKVVRRMSENGNYDLATAADMSLVDGVTAHISCAMDRRGTQGVTLVGTLGSIFVPVGHRPEEFTIEKDGNSRTITVPYEVDDLYSEIDAVVSAFEKSETELKDMTLEDSMRIAELSEAIRTFA